MLLVQRSFSTIIYFDVLTGNLQSLQGLTKVKLSYIICPEEDTQFQVWANNFSRKF